MSAPATLTRAAAGPRGPSPKRRAPDLLDTPLTVEDARAEIATLLERALSSDAADFATRRSYVSLILERLVAEEAFFALLESRPPLLQIAWHKAIELSGHHFYENTVTAFLNAYYALASSRECKGSPPSRTRPAGRATARTIGSP